MTSNKQTTEEQIEGIINEFGNYAGAYYSEGQDEAERQGWPDYEKTKKLLLTLISEKEIEAGLLMIESLERTRNYASSIIARESATFIYIEKMKQQLKSKLNKK